MKLKQVTEKLELERNICLKMIETIKENYSESPIKFEYLAKAKAHQEILNFIKNLK